VTHARSLQPISRLQRVPTQELLLAGTLLAGWLGELGCAPPAAAPAAVSAPAMPTAPTTSAAPTTPDRARGGRLYDSWRTERRLSSRYEYDRAGTVEPDGKGGPNGNGTLNDGLGRAMLNPGHDYRLKNFFGWDLRGKQGLSGPAYHAEPFVLERNLLEDPRSAEEIQAWLAHGDEQIPAYGQVLDERDLADLTAFLVQSRDAGIARPEQVYRIASDAPRNYSLQPGADLAHGHELFEFVCADCHGKDGRELPLDGGFSLGSFARARADEAWFKIQNGLAGSPMQGIGEPSGEQAARTVLDLLAALCDRERFPPAASNRANDVAEGDARCGAYLK